MFAVAADGNGACFSLTFWTVWQPLAWRIIRPCIQYTAGAASMASACSYTGRCVVHTDPHSWQYGGVPTLKITSTMLCTGSAAIVQNIQCIQKRGIVAMVLWTVSSKRGEKRCRLIMHRRICLSAGIVSNGETRRRKIRSPTLKNKLRRRRNIVNKYQVSRKCTTWSMPDCTCVVVEIIMTVH